MVYLYNVEVPARCMSGSGSTDISKYIDNIRTNVYRNVHIIIFIAVQDNSYSICANCDVYIRIMTVVMPWPLSSYML